MQWVGLYPDICPRCWALTEGAHWGQNSRSIASPAEYFRGRTVGLPLTEILKDMKALSCDLLVRDGSPVTLALEGSPLELDWFKVERLTRAPYKLINRASWVLHIPPLQPTSSLSTPARAYPSRRYTHARRRDNALPAYPYGL